MNRADCQHEAGFESGTWLGAWKWLSRCECFATKATGPEFKFLALT